MKLLPLLISCLAAMAFPVIGETVSPLFSRGYTALPSPQKVTLGTNDFEFGRDWRLELGPRLRGDIAVDEFKRLLSERFHLTLRGAADTSRNVRLAVVPNTVAIAGKTGKGQAARSDQAYRLTIASNEIVITGNTAIGLFYGVQTFAQLLKEHSGKLWLPEARIEDWPDTELRVIYWDDAHHLEHLDVLKDAVRQASFYKINGFAIKLEGHFQYRHAAPIVDPYALTQAELQDLTNYALKYHVQLIPYLDGPAHDTFILKHREYAALREYPDSNYEVCVTNPKTYQLFEGMMEDLLAANQGGKYFVLSTDEPYYVGLAQNAQCDEAARAKQLGSAGKMLAEFISKTADYLHAHGRTVIFWGEYPLTPDDIGALPSYLVNGEVYGPRFDPVFRSHGIRQMVYTSTEAEEPLFPQYYILPPADRLHQVEEDSSLGKVQSMLDTISFTSHSDLSSMRPGPALENQADLLGVLVAGWGDAGLHPETFWLGYATGPAAGWNRSVTNSRELQSCFYSLFYGQESSGMGRLYQLMSEGAQFWDDSWETGPSKARKSIWGNSKTQFHPPEPARDQYLPALPVISRELRQSDSGWREANKKRVNLASKFLAHNDELLDLLYANVGKVQLNQYNLSVYISIAGLYRQNLVMIQNLDHVVGLLESAQQAAERSEANEALKWLDRALDNAEGIRACRNQVLRDATAIWYKSWFPRVARANGRTYVHEVDDVKDHRPVRTIDMSYLVYRELLYPLGDWAEKVVASRNDYARSHNLPTRDFKLNWNIVD